MRKISESKSAPRWRTVRFWQEIFIYFWVFSLAGHYLEIIVAQAYHLLTGNPPWQPIIMTVVPLAAPYGMGVVTIILAVIPLMKRYHLQPISVFALSVVATSLVEYGSALFVVIFDGHNQFWNYSNLPYNINGYVALRSSVAFGVLAVIFIYCVYPYCEKHLRRIKDRHINILFWMLLIAYLVDLASAYLW